MAKAEISWKRTTAEGVRLQVYTRHVGRDWRFFTRAQRYDQWQTVPEPPLEDWLELLDAVPSTAASSYQPYWAVRAHLSASLGQREAARDAFGRAIALSDDPAIRAFLGARRAALGG